MELALRIFDIITPVLLIAAMGYGYARLRKPDMTWINRLSTDLLFPLLFFTSMASKDFDIREFLPLIGGALLVIAGSGIIAWGVSRLFGYNPRVFVPAMMFPNVGNMGLPLILLAFGPEMLAAGVAMFMIFNLTHVTIGIRICAPHANMRGVLCGPMLLAMIGGIISSLAGFTLPGWLDTGARLLGDAAIPLALFTLGVGFASFKPERWGVGITGAVLRPLSGLAIAWVLIHVLPLPPKLQGVLLLTSALPPAVFNYVFAEHYQQDPELASALVVAGTLASIFFVPLSFYLAF
jgi:predicted permease